jgi:hypothetical protein
MKAIDILRERIAADIEEFLNSGGRIDAQPILIRGPLPNYKAKAFDAARTRNHFQRKLSAQQATNIRRSKRSTRELAGQYGVTPDFIRKIKTGQRWRDSQA